MPGFVTVFPKDSALACCDTGGTDACVREETGAHEFRTWGAEESEGHHLWC